jgi:hypothetical protein
MKIVIHLSDDEGYRTVEDQEENIRPICQIIMECIEEALVKYQVRYGSVSVQLGK